MDLKNALDECQECFDNPPQNEANTCVWVILPLLYASGYARREVLAESADSGGKRPDYTLLPDDPEHKFYLEAKAWRIDLEDGHANQAINYANQNGKRWVLLSNGRNWRIYDNDIRGLAADKLVAEMSLENAGEARRFLAAIGKESVCTGRLPGFASVEADRRKREAQEKQLREDKNKRQSLLRSVLEEELADWQSPVVQSLVPCLGKRPGLEKITAGEVVAAFAQLCVSATASQLSEAKLYDHLSSVREFVRETCELGVNQRAWVNDLFSAWLGWTDRSGRGFSESRQGFGRELAAAFPQIRVRRNSAKGRFYEGIAVKNHTPLPEVAAGQS